MRKQLVSIKETLKTRVYDNHNLFCSQIIQQIEIDLSLTLNSIEFLSLFSTAIDTH